MTESAGLAIVRATHTTSRHTQLHHAQADHARLVRLLRAGELAAAEDLWRNHLTEGRNSVLDATASRMPAALYDIL